MSSFRHSLQRPLVAIILTVFILILLVWRVAVFTENRRFDEIQTIGNARLNLYASSLHEKLAKYHHIPYMLARDARIHALLQKKSNSRSVSPHLEDFAKAAGTPLLFVLNSAGITVASSNWRTDKDIVGSDLSFRPYFIDATNGKSGGYYAVGRYTRQPGFFISYPVLHVGEFLGAVVVKVDLEEVQTTWMESGESVIVSDAYGVVFLSSYPEWKFKSLRPLPKHTANRLRDIQYLERPLSSLKITRTSGDRGEIMQISGEHFLEQSIQLRGYGWRIHYLSNLSSISKSVHLAMTITTVAALVLLLLFLLMRERKLKQIADQEARNVLAVREVNKQLQAEIIERERTEKHLRATQRELIQAGKLAALGRMSAAIAHELNQPLTAIRTFVASCRIFVEREQRDSVVENLGYISKLTERMASITGQLKKFARKSNGKQERIDIVPVVEGTIVFVDPQFEIEGISLHKQLPDLQTAIVLGDTAHLEQVMSNLIHNAIDAMKDSDQKDLHIRVISDANTVIIEVQDSGKGIPDAALDYLFDPFFTTKDIGSGLGLGLSITYGIVKDMEGTIDASNRDGGGACFTIRLPLAEKNFTHRENVK